MQKFVTVSSAEFISYCNVFDVKPNAIKKGSFRNEKGD